MSQGNARIVNARFVFSLPKWNQSKVEPLPQICFAGRSNVGKSSLINALVEQKTLARTSSTPGRTQELVAFKAELRRGNVAYPFYLIDLPGFGWAKVPLSVKQSWLGMMQSYFVNNPELVCCVSLFDIRRTPRLEEEDLLEMLGEIEVPFLPVVTKADKIPKTKRPAQLKAIAKGIGLDDWRDLRPMSVLKREGIDELRNELFTYLQTLHEESGSDS